MTNEINIRDFEFSKDYANVIELWKNAGEGIQLRRSDEPDEILKKIKRDPDLFLVAESQGKLIGAVMGGFDGRRGLMYHLAVQREFRKLGIATQLTEMLEDRLRKKGCIRYYLLVTKNNDEAIRFYKDREWEEMDLIVMAKNLG
jgi:ribosomal protein S18 acetylase RimI-like enzyme